MKTFSNAKHFAFRGDDHVHGEARYQNIPHYAVTEKPQNGKRYRKNTLIYPNTNSTTVM